MIFKDVWQWASWENTANVSRDGREGNEGERHFFFATFVFFARRFETDPLSKVWVRLQVAITTMSQRGNVQLRKSN